MVLGEAFGGVGSISQVGNQLIDKLAMASLFRLGYEEERTSGQGPLAAASEKGWLPRVGRTIINSDILP